MPPVRYKILVDGELKHTDLPYSLAIDYVMKYIHTNSEVTIKAYHPLK